MSIHGISAHPFVYSSSRSGNTCKNILGVYSSRRLFSSTLLVDSSRRLFSFTSVRRYQKDHLVHTCDVDTEPLHRYRSGGYHPTRLEDVLKYGRYKRLHKLGWGGYSTVWAARDQRCRLLLPLGISISERGERNREFKVLNAIAAVRSEHPGARHLLGPSVPSLLDVRFHDERLPGKLAKTIAKQALLGVDYLHQHKIGHGDLHTCNLTFTIPSLYYLSEEEFLQELGKPEIGLIKKNDGGSLEPDMPKYLVRPASYLADSSLLSHPIKIIDFGELDYRVDLWSMGCMLVELVVGQPPFDSFMITPIVLVRQILEQASDGLPERWQQKWREMGSTSPGEMSGYTLQGWLEEMYFDEERNEDLSREDISKVGELVRRMLRFEPSNRASASEILRDPWFKGK
ncbi:kinase-like protein [Bimuria novae-zelandiae CBS 107.79]|uniref:Kinase-like protein n=1 Tax=Bimuria novae-zelandiae CBS 107.79 TaxID=1447943 RepID=A0A6A5V5J7_9PLEO|nr:kinase-like protein [Bimuria novae-zelandiae CBS 107.79]